MRPSGGSIGVRRARPSGGSMPIEGRRACPSGGSTPVGGRPPASSADSIFVLKSRRFGKRGGGLCAHRAGPSVANGRARRAGPRPLRADGRARQAGPRIFLKILFAI